MNTRSSPTRCFVDPANGDFRLKPDSPALKIGFEPFDYTQAGVYGDPAWVEKANEVTYPPLEWPPDPPAMAIKDDFEKTPVGAKPAGAEVHVENKGDSIEVTDETAAGGTHSLKITDAPGLQNAFNPHLVYSPNHGSGTTRCSFDLRLGPGVSINHEWRDWRLSPYAVGPSFWINGNILQVAGKTLLTLPGGTWVHFEIAADLGKDNSHTWDLTVTLPGGTPKVQGPQDRQHRLRETHLARLRQQRHGHDHVLPRQSGDHEPAIEASQVAEGNGRCSRHGKRRFLCECPLPAVGASGCERAGRVTRGRSHPGRQLSHRPNRGASVLFDEHGWQRILAVSHFYHLPRVKLTYQRQGRDVYTVRPGSPIDSRPCRSTWREVAALWAYYARPLW